MMMEGSRKHIEINHLLRTLRKRDLRTDEWILLQQLAADDPFLKESIEGLNSIPADKRIAHLQNIIRQLRQKEKHTFKGSGIGLWVGVAASICICIAAVYLIKNVQWQRNSQVVQDISITQDDAPSVVNSGSEFTLNEPTTAHADQAANNPIDSKSAIHVSPSPETSRSKKESPDESDSPEISPDAGATGTQLNSAHEITYDAEQQTSTPGSQNMTADEETMHLDFSPVLPEVKGVVLNHLGEPMRGAAIQLKGTQARTQTDYLGNFALDIPLSTPDNTLVISPAGYAPVETIVIEGDSLIVRLADKRNPASAEITTLTQERAASTSRPSDRALAKPLNGERSYNKYLRQNLRYPPKAADANIHGTVILEFDLNAKGSPISFRIIKSVGYGCDEEAIRLIREGPKWDVSTAQVKMGRIEIAF